MTQTPLTTEEVVAAYEAERQAQAAQRVMVSEAAWNLRLHADCGLCTSGINNWLRDRRCPAIPDPENRPRPVFQPEEALQAALRSIPGLQNAELYSPLGLQRQVTDRQEAGRNWVLGMVRSLEQLQREYPGDITGDQVPRLIRRLRGEPEPEPNTAAEAAPAAASAPRSAPAPGMTNVDMTATFTIQIPTRNIPGVSAEQVRATAEATVRDAINQMVRRSPYGAHIEHAIQYDTTVQQS